MVLAVLAAGQFVMALDSSVMNVSIPVVARDVGTDVTGIQTAITLYALVMTCLMITAGKVGQMLGRGECHRDRRRTRRLLLPEPDPARPVLPDVAVPHGRSRPHGHCHRGATDADVDHVVRGGGRHSEAVPEGVTPTCRPREGTAGRLRGAGPVRDARDARAVGHRPPSGRTRGLGSGRVEIRSGRAANAIVQAAASNSAQMAAPSACAITRARMRSRCCAAASTG